MILVTEPSATGMYIGKSVNFVYQHYLSDSCHYPILTCGMHYVDGTLLTDVFRYAVCVRIELL